MNHHELLLGRPFGGCGIVYHKSIAHLVKSIDCSSYTRFCAVSCHFDCNLLLICVYFPTDYRHNSDSEGSFIETLAELEALLMSVTHDNVIIAGDFNVDLKGSGQRRQSIIDFMHSHDLVCADYPNTNIEYTYCSDNGRSHSWPDHVLVSSRYSNILNSVSVICSPENFSDHLRPLSFSIAYPPSHSVSSPVLSTPAPSAKAPQVD